MLLEKLGLYWFPTLVFFVAGYEFALIYIQRKKNLDDRQRNIRLAIVDMISYLLTVLPLIVAMVFALNADPLGGGVFDPEKNSTNFAIFVVLSFAAVGVGMGIARRRVTISLARS